VPFCRRTAAAEIVETAAGQFPTVEVICAKHWRPVDPKRRRAWRRLAKLIRTAPLEDLVDIGRRAGRVWDALRREAIEAAGGIA
jgi:hypothetical protein